MYLGNHPSGYTSFRYYITDVPLNFGDNSDNVLAVYVDPLQDEGWWYEGIITIISLLYDCSNNVYHFFLFCV